MYFIYFFIIRFCTFASLFTGFFYVSPGSRAAGDQVPAPAVPADEGHASQSALQEGVSGGQGGAGDQTAPHQQCQWLQDS